MATFPESVYPQLPLSIEPVWDTLIHITDSGAEQRRQKSLYPRFNVKFKNIWQRIRRRANCMGFLYGA